MQHSYLPPPPPPPKKSNAPYILITIVAAILIVIILFLILKNKRPDEAPQAPDHTAIVVDTTQPKPFDPDEGFDDDPFLTSYRVLKDVATPSGVLRKGDIVQVSEAESSEDMRAVYPNGHSKNAKPVYLSLEYFLRESSYEEYKEYFSAPPFSTLPPGVQRLLLEHTTVDEIPYRPSQNSVRTKSTVAYGDFDGDGIRDVAVIMENLGVLTSRLYVFSTNHSTHQYYLAHTEPFSDLMRIRSFKKGAPIYRNTEAFIAAPRDGLVVTGEDVVLVVLYEPELQKYKTYFQE